MKWINPFVPNVKNLTVFCFQGVEKRYIGGINHEKTYFPEPWRVYKTLISYIFQMYKFFFESLFSEKNSKE